MSIAPLPFLAIAALAQGGVQSKQVDGKLTVEFRHQAVDLQTGHAVYSGGVKATYGPTVLYADTLELVMNEAQSRGLAEGNIRLVDPDGQMTADKLEFDWKNDTGEALNVVIKSFRMTIRAKSLKIRPGNWTFVDVAATSCDRAVPLYLIRAPRIDVQPGRRAIVRHIELQAFGSRVASLPYYRLSLDNSATEFAMPRISLDEEGKSSASVTNAFYLDPNTLLGSSVKVADGLYPKYAASISRNLLTSKEASGSFSPQSELGDSSRRNFFDSVTVMNPFQEKAYLGQTRSALTVGTYWNQRTPGRLVNQTLNKPIEVIYELGGGSEGFDALGQLRLQSIGLANGPRHERAVASSVVSLPVYGLAKNLQFASKLSAIAFLNPGGEYSWGQAQLGLIYTPVKDVFVGGAYEVADEFGSPLFQSDRPYSKSSLNLRLHWGLGPTKIGFLAKYDFSQRRWYDDEISFSQVAGCVEPYFVWRRFPREISFGVGLRLDEFFDKLSKRQPITRP